ncbi:MAG: DNA polymerase III subunit alpha, partial [Chloroflexi bacterium]|nr:DNA polymerase III subunit alpha [Chloroflexota bacterium]
NDLPNRFTIPAMQTDGGWRQRFTHLQVHSHYTLLGGTASIADLVARAAADGLPALALADGNALYGVVAFAGACQAAGIQPIIGMTVTAAAPAEENPVAGAAGRLVLLATGPDGYRSLCRLSSSLQGIADRETALQRGLAWDTLKANAAGLICLSGGRMGWIEHFLRAGNTPAAGRYAARLGGIFGENAYLGLELNRPEDQAVAGEVIALGQRFGLRPVAVQPVFCLSPEDAPRLRLLAAIDRNCPLAAVPESPTAGHWLSPEEVAARFADFPEALAGVGEIVAACGPALPGSRPVWPALKLPQGQTPAQTLARQAKAGLAERYARNAPAGARQRLEHELAAIGRHGYEPLFLVVADVVRFARQAGVPVSTRGSVANSLVAYCTGITTVDPIAHELLFERFLTPARANPPDIDLDLCSRRRDEVLAYIRRTYGAEQVALVATMSTMRPKSAVRETGKAYGLDEAEIDQLVRLLPPEWHPDPRRRVRRLVEEIAAQAANERQREVIHAAYALLGQPHHVSIHPGGVVITPGPLTEFVPVQWTPKGFLVTQFDYRDLEALGLPKLDLLGIRALTVLADTAELIRQQADPAFRLDEIPLTDEATAGLLVSGETIGVFQCESAGARRTLRQLQARTVQDLAVANAFFKPGPAMGGMARTFIRRYRGEEPVSYLHPALASILASTQGVLLFQEQILRIATEVAGLGWEQADHLRRGMSKFQAEEMATMEAQFVAGCCRPVPDGPAFTPDQARTLWEQVLAFAGYGFNRGHATAYADVSYRSAYLKSHWPAEFLCARLADYGGFHHPAIYMAEAVRLGIAVRPPHVNYSDAVFTLAYEPGEEGMAGLQPVLWMGLGQVRDLRRDSIEAIMAGRRSRPFASLDDLMERVALQGREVAHLVQCGALDGLGSSRAAMLAGARTIQRAGNARQMSFAFAAPAVPAESAAERLAWERRILGLPVSVHPLALVGRLPRVTPLSRLPASGGRRVTVAGVRLPGWTGGPGFFLGDGQTFVVARGDKSLKAPRPWQPLRLSGRWQSDERGTEWLQVEELEEKEVFLD